jgi:hypothetical protein
MKRVSADSSCSVVWYDARAACAEVSTGSMEASEAKHGPSTYRRSVIVHDHILYNNWAGFMNHKYSAGCYGVPMIRNCAPPESCTVSGILNRE